MALYRGGDSRVRGAGVRLLPTDVCPGTHPLVKSAHPSHMLRVGMLGGTDGKLTEIVFYTTCWAHGSRKAIALCRPCGAAGVSKADVERSPLQLG